MYDAYRVALLIYIVPILILTLNPNSNPNPNPNSLNSKPKPSLFLMAWTHAVLISTLTLFLAQPILILNLPIPKT